MNKNLFVYLLLLILLVQFSSGVLGLGISPGRTSVEFDKPMEKDYQFTLLNNEHKEMQVFLMVRGELNQSVKMFDSIVEFMPSEESKVLNFKLNLQGNLQKEPGLHTAEIVALEVPKAGGDGSFVGATVSVVSQIHVFVSCPGKCVETDLSVFDAETGGLASFVIPVINRGKVGICDLRAVIDIYTSLNEKVDSVETNYKSLEPGERTELVGKWNVSVNSGDYLAKVTLFYDGESVEIKKPFSVGDKSLTIESILVNSFRLGEIAKLRILVENHWSDSVGGAYANLIVYDSDNQAMADIRSASEDIPALSKKELIAYWDTVGVGEGEYSGKLMVKYGERSTDKNLVLKVSEDSLEVFGVGYAIRPEGTEGTNIIFILIVLVVLMLVVNLAWFVFFKRAMGKKKSIRK